MRHGKRLTISRRAQQDVGGCKYGTLKSVLATTTEVKDMVGLTFDVPVQLPLLVEVLESLQQLPRDDRNVLLPEHTRLELCPHKRQYTIRTSSSTQSLKAIWTYEI